MSMASVIPETVTGTLLSLVELFPSSPQELRPQHLTVPSDITAHVCQRFIASLTAPELMPVTDTGYARFVREPSPSWP